MTRTRSPSDRTTRRSLLASGAALAVTSAAGRPARAAAEELLVGAATVDTTPPVGIALAGFHRPPDDPRLVTGSRQPTAVRAIAIGKGSASAVIVAVDVLAVSADFARRCAEAVASRLRIPADCVRLCATHTHSMPSFITLEQWGAVSHDYREHVMKRVVEAAEQAWHDRAAATLRVGSSRVDGGNSNRTCKPGEWRTDADFGPDSDDSRRWLDTMLHAVVFERAEGRPPIIAYHFSAHPVCFNDTLSGPDWPGIVAERCRKERGVELMFLQGHIGDVNPGDGSKWIGDADSTALAVWKGLDAAIVTAREMPVDRLESIRRPIDLPLDLARQRDWLAAYRADPAACTDGQWVDAGFAAAWFEAASAVATPAEARRTTLSALHLGAVSLFFHPAELYSSYGLTIRRDSPAATTLCVGFTDDFVGYLPDPAAFANKEYSAIVVPKILGLPPFTTDAARRLVTSATALLADHP